jgi:hypothetical protein
MVVDCRSNRIATRLAVMCIGVLLSSACTPSAANQGETAITARSSPTGDSQAAVATEVAQQVRATLTAVTSTQAKPTVAKPAVAPPKSAAAVPNTPVGVTRFFFQSLMAGDVNTALTAMSSVAQVSTTVDWRRFSTAIQPCAKSAGEYTAERLGLVRATFIPNCGNLLEIWLSIRGESLPAQDRQSLTNKLIGYCVVSVGRVDDVPRIMEMVSCGPLP